MAIDKTLIETIYKANWFANRTALSSMLDNMDSFIDNQMVLLNDILESLENPTKRRKIYFMGTGVSQAVGDLLAASFYSLGIEAEGVDIDQLGHAQLSAIINGEGIPVFISKTGKTENIIPAIKILYDKTHNTIHSLTQSDLGHADEINNAIALPNVSEAVPFIPSTSVLQQMVVIYSTIVTLDKVLGNPIRQNTGNHFSGTVFSKITEATKNTINSSKKKYSQSELKDLLTNNLKECVHKALEAIYINSFTAKNENSVEFAEMMVKQMPTVEGNNLIKNTEPLLRIGSGKSHKLNVLEGETLKKFCSQSLFESPESILNHNTEVLGQYNTIIRSTSLSLNHQDFNDIIKIFDQQAQPGKKVFAFTENAENLKRSSKTFHPCIINGTLEMDEDGSSLPSTTIISAYTDFINILNTVLVEKYQDDLFKNLPLIMNKTHYKGDTGEQTRRILNSNKDNFVQKAKMQHEGKIALAQETNAEKERAELLLLYNNFGIQHDNITLTNYGRGFYL